MMSDKLKKMVKTLAASLLGLTVVCCGLAACDGDDGPAENAGEVIDDGIDKVKDGVEKIGDKVEDATN